MRWSVVLLASMMFISMFPAIRGSDPDPGMPSRDLSFIETGETTFDSTSAPGFISVGDWNNDGYDDLLFNGHRLFMNTGPSDFNFILMDSVFNGTVSGSSNGVWADWDGDGDLDLYQGCRKGFPDRFWENQGAPDFILEDISEEVFGSYSNFGPNTGNAWCDFDGDGDLDIYVGNGEDWNDGDPVYYPDFLLRNENGLFFTDVSSGAGILTGENLYSRGVTWGDHDNDRWPDAYVSHYRIRENHLFVNGMDGTMEEMGKEKNCSGTYDTGWYEDREAGRVYGQTMWGPTWGHTIGSEWADFNRDGNLDLWTSDFVHKYVGYINSWYDIRGYICDDGNLYINDGPPHYTFTDYRNTSGIPIWPVGGQGTFRGDQTFSGITIGDYDNDGWEDMYIPQVYGNLPYTTPHLFRNRGPSVSAPNGTTFEDMTQTLGIEGANTYACIFFDKDNDGDLDLVTGGADTWDGSEWTNYRVRLYENQGTGENRYLRVKLNGTGMNPDAIGARVTMWIDNEEEKTELLVREVRAGTGHAHQKSNVLHFGLGDGIDPEKMDIFGLQVRWPDGKIHWARVREADTTLYINYPTDEFPTIDDVLITPANPIEDQEVKIDVISSPGTWPDLSYYWDLDGDNIFEKVTEHGSIKITPREGGMRHVRCQVSAGPDPSNERLIAEAYPIEIDVKNRKPEVKLNDFRVEMDSTFHPGSGVISDTESDLKNISWNVSWGDGSYDRGKGPLLPAHIYTEPGDLMLTITVSDEEFTVEGSAIVSVTNVEPEGYLEIVSPAGPIEEDMIVTLKAVVNDTPSDGPIFEVNWDFGNGLIRESLSDETVTISYDSKGNYTVNAEVRDNFGGMVTISRTFEVLNVPPILRKNNDVEVLMIDEDERIDLDMMEGIDTTSDLRTGLEYMWDLDDGNTTTWSHSSFISHTYERTGIYHPVCRVKDDDGSVGSGSQKIVVRNVPPKLDDEDLLSIIPLTPSEDETITISISGTDTPSDLPYLRYTLYTGDGRILMSHDGKFTLSYPMDGVHSARITLIDDDGDIDEIGFQIPVRNVPPSGKAEADRYTVQEDESITFRATSVTDTESDIDNLTFEWDLGGTSSASGKEITHTYTLKGIKKVTLSISDSTDTTLDTITIVVRNPQPVAVIDILPDSDPENGTFHLSGSSSSDNPSDIGMLRFLWDMGDGEILEGVEIKHTYEEEGEFEIVLTVFDDDQDYSMDTITVTVKYEPEYEPARREDRGMTGTIFLIAIVSVLIIISAVIIVLLATDRMRGQRPDHSKINEIDRR